MFILFISFITRTRALIFGHTGHYSFAIVSHYTTKPILTEFGSNCGPTRLVTILLQVFANFLDALGPGNGIANVAPRRFLGVLRPPGLRGALLVTMPGGSDRFRLIGLGFAFAGYNLAGFTLRRSSFSCLQMIQSYRNYG